MTLEKEVRIVASRAKSLEELMQSGKNWVNTFEKQGIICKGISVLDFGAGVGRFSINLKEYGCDVTAIERNDNMFAYLVGQGIDTHQAEDLVPVKGKKFDIAIAMFVFQHIGRKKVDKILKQMSQVTGKICFTLPTEYKGGSYKSQTTGKNEVHTESETSYVYTEDEVKELVAPYFPNFKKLDVKNENVYIAFV